MANKGLSLGALKKDRLRVSGDDIFYTLQGEGPTIGTPVIFLRLHECNLKCKWGNTICDAAYTWNKDWPEYWKEPVEYSITQMVERMKAAMNEHKCHHWVISGGEPMMQKEQLTELLDLLDVEMDWIEFETNGTIKPTEWMLKTPWVHFNCSPKLSNSDGLGHKKSQRLNAPVIYELSKANTYFKFVVMREEDVPEIKEYISYMREGFPAERIFLMPEGVTREELAVHTQVCDRLCKEQGWRLTPRLQIELYGDKRAT